MVGVLLRLLDNCRFGNITFRGDAVVGLGWLFEVGITWMSVSNSDEEVPPIFSTLIFVKKSKEYL